MPYRILTSRRVEKQIDALPQKIADRIVQHVEALHTDPRPYGVKKLKGYTDIYRVRMGDYRIVYTIDEKTQIVTLLTVDNRKDVYC